MGKIGALWGIAGVTLLLGYAIVRLAQIGLDSFSYDYQWYHWVILAGWHQYRLFILLIRKVTKGSRNGVEYPRSGRRCGSDTWGLVSMLSHSLLARPVLHDVFPYSPELPELGGS